MNFNLFVLTVRARWLLFAVAFSITVVAAVTFTLMLPKSYKATASLLVDAKDEQSMNSALRPLVNSQELVSYLQTQTDVISSEKVARKVIEELALARDPLTIAAYNEMPPGRAGTIEDWLVESLHQGLEVQTAQSSVIQITFTGADPVLSAAIANAFAKAYIGTMLELRVEPTREAAVWFDEQLKSLRVNLQEAQAKLTDYHRSRGIVSADEHYDVEHTRLDSLSDQVSKAQEVASNWKSREVQARASLSQKGLTEKLPDVLDNSYIQKLKEDLSQGESRLQQMSTQVGVNHPQYQRQNSENEGMRMRLREEMEKLVASITSTANQARAREEELRRAMAAQRSRILDLKEDRNELTVLRRNAESAERAYDTAMQRFVASQVESRANQTNVSILNEAAPPRRHFRPRTTLNLLVSLVVGAILGTASVLLAELFDRRVRSRRDLELDVPLLAVLNAWQLPGASKSRQGVRHAVQPR